MEIQDRDSDQALAELANHTVPSFVYDRTRYATRGDNKDKSGCDLQAGVEPPPFSNPSPVTSQDKGQPFRKPLQRESSDSSSVGSEPKAKQQQQRRITLPAPISTEEGLKPQVKALGGGGGDVTYDDGGGGAAICQDLKQQAPNQRPSLSSNNDSSPVEVTGVQATSDRYPNKTTKPISHRFPQCVGAPDFQQKFREIDVYASRSDFTNIYLTENSVLGIAYEKMERLGSGGNGIVYSYGNHAIKKTRYSEEVLNIIREFDHPNLVPLLGVTLLGPFSEACYLIMPLMTYDLRRALHPITLVQLAKDSDEETWMIVKSNVKYILGEILKALFYLDCKCVQHGDIKGKNILVKKTCRCSHILRCTCSIDSGEKYRVFMADYDYVRKCHSEATNLLNHRDNCHVHRYTGGTPSYRAPEESFIFCEEGAHQGRRLGGHSSDMYSFGVLLLRMCIGEGTWKDHVNANILVGQLHTSKLAPESEAVFTVLMLNKLSEAARSCCGSRMNFLADIVTQCTKPNPSDRPTAYELLKKVEAF